MQKQGGMLRKAKTFFGDDFDGALAWYLENGVVYCDDSLIVMAVKHNKDRLMQRNHKNVLDKLDSWYVQYVAGDLQRLFEIMPEEMDWVVFERHEQEEPRCYRLKRIRQKLGV